METLSKGPGDGHQPGIKEQLTALVVRAQRGERDAFENIVRLTERSVFRFVYGHTRDRQIAADICQEAFLRSLECLGQLREPEAFYGWLMRCARNLYLDRLKRSSSRNHYPLDTVSMPSSPDPSPNVEAREAVLTALAALKAAERTVLLLVDGEGFSYDEAARKLDVTSGVLRSRLNRARRRFIEVYRRS